MSRKEQLYKCSNTIIELSRLLSDKLWSDDSIKDRFALAAFSDGIHLAATELDELANYLTDPDDNDLKAADQNSSEAG